jgi:hypothetical protein
MSERFVKAIRARDVRIRDVMDDGEEVVSAETDRLGTCLKYKKGGDGYGPGSTLLHIIHRPWPEGMTEQAMLERIQLYAKTLQGFSEVVPEAMESHIKLIREAIEAYELGKPLLRGKPARKI